MWLRGALALAAAAMLTSACLGRGERAAWHAPTGVSTEPGSGPSTAGRLPFKEYVAATTATLEDALRKTGPGLAAEERARLARLRAHFEWPPDPDEWRGPPDRCPSGPAAGARTGILTIHGTTERPCAM